MFHKPVDFLAIGDITTDAFIRIKDARVHCDIHDEHCEICMKFADKVPFESVHVIKAVGNSANASVSASRLGLSSALVTNLGDDHNGHDCMGILQKEKVSTRYAKMHKDKPTNYHFVLWYEAERTILVNHISYRYSLPELSPPRWIYLSSLASGTEEYHEEIASYLKKNPNVKLAFQPGTYQMKLGMDKIRYIYERAEIFVVNVEESQRILNIDSNDAGGRDIKKLLSGLAELGPKIVHITDGPKGSYMYDGDRYYYMPIYPDPAPPLERTGCGDAYASTFVSAIAMGKTPLEALLWAPVNPMSVVQHIGARDGLLTRVQIEAFLHKAPRDYVPKEI